MKVCWYSYKHSGWVITEEDGDIVFAGPFNDYGKASTAALEQGAKMLHLPWTPVL